MILARTDQQKGAGLCKLQYFNAIHAEGQGSPVGGYAQEYGGLLCTALR